jgi:NADPH:quinone reductase-like Zn-dependent oxidoreductase
MFQAKLPKWVAMCKSLNPGTGSMSRQVCIAVHAPHAGLTTRQIAPTLLSAAISVSAQNRRSKFDAYPYGGMGEYMLAPQHNLVPLPDSVTFEQAARFGYLGTAYAALRKANVGPGTTILVNGATRVLGLGAVLIALGRGATRVLGTARQSHAS